MDITLEIIAAVILQNTENISGATSLLYSGDAPGRDTQPLCTWAGCPSQAQLQQIAKLRSSHLFQTLFLPLTTKKKEKE